MANVIVRCKLCGADNSIPPYALASMPICAECDSPLNTNNQREPAKRTERRDPLDGF